MVVVVGGGGHVASTDPAEQGALLSRYRPVKESSLSPEQVEEYKMLTGRTSTMFVKQFRVAGLARSVLAGGDLCCVRGGRGGDVKF